MKHILTRPKWSKPLPGFPPKYCHILWIKPVVRDTVLCRVCFFPPSYRILIVLLRDLLFANIKGTKSSFMLILIVLFPFLYLLAFILFFSLQVIGTPQRPTVSNAILVNSPHTPSSQFLTQSQPSEASPWSSGLVDFTFICLEHNFGYLQRFIFIL